MSGALVPCGEEKKSGDTSYLTDFFLNRAKLKSSRVFPSALKTALSFFTLQEFVDLYQSALKDKARLVAFFDWMEQAHDYIQYFFPLIALSQSNGSAPRVQPITVKLFKGGESLTQQQVNLIELLKIMLHFMGLTLRTGESNESKIVIENLKGPVERGYGFDFIGYFSRHTHNYRRFSRMVQSLVTLGLEKYALALFECLIHLYPKPGQGNRIEYLCLGLIAPQRMGLDFNFVRGRFFKDNFGGREADWVMTEEHRKWLLVVKATFDRLRIDNPVTRAFNARFFPQIAQEQKAEEVKDHASKRIAILKDTIEKLNSDAKREVYKKQARINHARWEAEKKGSESPEKRVQVLAGDWGAVTSELSKKTGKIYAVLNMANAYVPGGGYREGKVAQEENMFRRTDCHFSISDAERDAKDKTHYNQESTNLINGEDGLVYLDIASPRVCIKGPEELKEGVVNGYQDLAPEDYFLFFELRSAADDLRALKRFNKESMRQKIRAQLETLKKNGIRHVVLSAFGCGAFRNPSKEVAKLYKEELEKMPDCFDEVIFAIYNAGYGHDNYQAFYDTLQGMSLSWVPPTRASLSYDSYSAFGPTIIGLIKHLGLFIVAAGLLELIASGTMALITHSPVLGISAAMGPSIIGFAALLLLIMVIIYCAYKISSEKNYAEIEPVASFAPKKAVKLEQSKLTPAATASHPNKPQPLFSSSSVFDSHLPGA